MSTFCACPGQAEVDNHAKWERESGSDWRENEEQQLEAFAYWAFRSTEFPSLQVLMSGDLPLSRSI